jgi:hypothetical protein
VDERVELAIGQSPDVQWRQTRTSESKTRQDWRVDLTNARAVPVKVEVIVPYDLADKPPGIERGREGWVLPVTVPENGTASVSYAVKFQKP